MGWNLTKACVLTTLPMSDRARLVLVRMSLRTYDQQPKRSRSGLEPDVYYGGWDWLGLLWDDGIRTPEARHQIVKRAVRELVERGYVKPIEPATKGHRAAYRVLVDYGRSQAVDTVDNPPA